MIYTHLCVSRFLMIPHSASIIPCCSVVNSMYESAEGSLKFVYVIHQLLKVI